MPRFNAYISDATMRMLGEILSNVPGESLAGLFAEGVRRRHSEIFGCAHTHVRCTGCGAVLKGTVPRDEPGPVPRSRRSRAS